MFEKNPKKVKTEFRPTIRARGTTAMANWHGITKNCYWKRYSIGKNTFFCIFGQERVFAPPLVLAPFG